MKTLILTISAALSLAACASNQVGTLDTGRYDRRLSTVDRDRPIVIESKISDIGAAAARSDVQEPQPANAAEKVVAAAEKKPTPLTAAQESKSPKIPLPKVDRKQGYEPPPVITGEPPESAPTMSLLIRKDDIEEEELNSLLASDYLHQFDIPIVFNDAVQYYVRYFSTEKRKILINWLRRSRRYAPMIRTILREQGLPEDLLYLAMIESGFNPKAYSSAKACGPWQFIYETGGRYGLTVNHWVDERRDPEKSTVAAALYLKDLFNQFGSWYLAAAGYNAGEKRIEKAVERHETTDFWEISRYNTLPRETRDYIPRLLAAAIIAKDPEKFGLSNINYDEPIRVVNVPVPGGVALTTVARAAALDVPTIQRLNPELLTGITPPEVLVYSLKLPEGIRKEKFRISLQESVDKERRVQSVMVYTFKKKDSLSSVLKRFKMNQGDVALVNSCDEPLRSKQGRVIYIPTFTKPEGEDETDVVRVAQLADKLVSKPEMAEVKKETRAAVKVQKKARSQDKPVKAVALKEYHVVKKGESLGSISEKYGIDAGTLKEINGIKRDQLRPNMRLRLTRYVKSDKDEKRAESATYHVVKKGETLSAIADRYDVSMTRMRTINKLKKDHIHSGMKLKITSTKGKARPGAQG